MVMMTICQEGERLGRRGYWGDIVVSPYVTFGIECKDQSFFKKTNNMFTKVRLRCVVCFGDIVRYNTIFV